MDFTQAHQQEMLDWYTKLAKNPGWKAYAWHRVNEMATDNPEMYAGLPAKLLAAVPPKSSGERKTGGG